MKKYWILSVNDVCISDKKYAKNKDAIDEAKRQYNETNKPVVILECVGVYESSGQAYHQIWEMEEDSEPAIVTGKSDDENL